MMDESSMPMRPTDKMPEGMGDKLKSMVKDHSSEMIRHMGNHMHNMADMMEDHMRGKVSMKDFEKMMSRKGESE